MAGHDKPDLPRHRNIFWMIAAPTVWAVHFVVTYSTAAVACANGAGAPVSLILWYTLAAEAAVIAIAVALWRQWDYLDDQDREHDRGTDEHRREFLGHAGFMLACLSFVAILFTAMPAWLAGTCL